MKKLILLGKDYIFNEIEIKKLRKKFEIVYIDLKQNTNTIIEEISKLHISSNSIIIQNQSDIPLEIKTFLTDRSLELHSLNIIMEKYLKKVYIPYEFKNLDYLEDLRGYTKIEYLIKRFLDYIIAFVLGFLSIPVILYSIYRIKRESPGDILYKQSRVGKNNREFIAYKFRSMIPDAEKGSPKFASKDDPRVFKWGAFMRKTRIDEIPQLINVLKGEMHVIGPRPERKVWIELFEKQIPYYNHRHIVAPGITGWAQVNYPYGSNTEDARQKLMYDLYYIKYWNLWLEIKIIFKTVIVILKKQGQ